MFLLKFGNVPTVWYFWGEMFRQCGIFGGKCSDIVVFFGGNVPTVWYFWGEMFRQCGIFERKCSDSVVFFAFHSIICTEQDKIYCLYFCTLPSNYYLIFTCCFGVTIISPTYGCHLSSPPVLSGYRVAITTDFVSSNLDQDEVYNIM